MTDVPEGFLPIEPPSPYHELIGPFYVRTVGKTLMIGLEIARKHINRGGVVHGGMICSLMDFAMGEASRRTSTPPRRYVTTSLSVEFAGNAREGAWVEAHADVMRAGRRMVFLNCFVYHAGQPIARGSATFLPLDT